jgi:ParB-like chromosome segregation protein Spo0J
MNERLAIEYIDIGTIKPYEKNAKLHPQSQIEQIKTSIKDYGMNNPIAIWNGVIVEGHGRYEACKQLHFDKVPVIRLDDLTDEQRKEYILVHNQTTMNSGFDQDVLQSELEQLENFDFELYEFEEIEKMENDVKEADIETIELRPYEKVHYLISLDINDHDKIIDLIQKIKEIEGIEVESTIN